MIQWLLQYFLFSYSHFKEHDCGILLIFHIHSARDWYPPGICFCGLLLFISIFVAFWSSLMVSLFMMCGVFYLPVLILYTFYCYCSTVSIYTVFSSRIRVFFMVLRCIYVCRYEWKGDAYPVVQPSSVVSTLLWAVELLCWENILALCLSPLRENGNVEYVYKRMTWK